MLKKIIIFLLCILISPLVYANTEDEMIWNTIAPKQYQGELQYIEDNTFFNKHPFLSSFSCVTLVTIPFFFKSVEKSTEIDRNNYWYSRKQDFNNHISLCNNLSNKDEQTKCKISVLQNENGLTMQQKQLQAIQSLNTPQYSHSTTTRYGNTYHTNTYSY